MVFLQIKSMAAVQPRPTSRSNTLFWNVIDKQLSFYETLCFVSPLELEADLLKFLFSLYENKKIIDKMACIDYIIT